MLTPGPKPLNHLTHIHVYGSVPYILRSLYNIRAVFMTLYDLRSPYEKVHTVLVKWGVSLNTKILFGTLLQSHHVSLQSKLKNELYGGHHQHSIL
jgi:hypothetical protein